MSNYDKKLEDLSRLVSEQETQVSRKDSKYSTTLIIGAIVPVIVALALYLFKPGFVSVTKNGKKTVVAKKVALYTLGVSAVAWVGLGLYAFY